MNNKKMSNLKPIVSISEMVKMLQLSRARFYQLLQMEFFPKPLYDNRSKRPINGGAKVSHLAGGLKVYPCN